MVLPLPVSTPEDAENVSQGALLDTLHKVGYAQLPVSLNVTDCAGGFCSRIAVNERLLGVACKTQG